MPGALAGRSHRGLLKTYNIVATLSTVFSLRRNATVAAACDTADGDFSPNILAICTLSIRAIERRRLTAATPAKNPRHRARAARPLSHGRSP